MKAATSYFEKSFLKNLPQQQQPAFSNVTKYWWYFSPIQTDDQISVLNLKGKSFSISVEIE